MSGFSMKIEEAFQVKGRSVVLCGTVNRADLHDELRWGGLR